MGGIFDARTSNKQLTTSTAAQTGVQDSLAEFFQGQIGQGFGLEQLADLFEPGFLKPALQGFNASGGTRENIEAGFASIGGTLSSRREQSLTDALTTVQTQAQGQFIQQAPALLNSLFQPFQAANQFAFGSAFENVTTQNPSVFQQGVGLAGAIGAGAGGFGDLATGLGDLRNSK